VRCSFGAQLRYLLVIESTWLGVHEEERAIEGREDGGVSTLDEMLVALMQTHETALFRFLFVLTGDREAALDCTQDTFLRAYHNLDAGKPVNAGWLYKVAHNIDLHGSPPNFLTVVPGSETSGQVWMYGWFRCRGTPSAGWTAESGGIGRMIGTRWANAQSSSGKVELQLQGCDPNRVQIRVVAGYMWQPVGRFDYVRK
jgi:hypothetical protein